MAVLMVSNTVAIKLIQIGPFVFTGAIFIFPISYIFGDILTEVYGYRATRKIIWSGFAALLFMSLAYTLVLRLPAAPFWKDQAAFESILGLVPRVVIASVVGYLMGEFVNSYIMSKVKTLMDGNHLWVRTIGSTIVGEGVDTIFFVSILFGGVLPLTEILTIMWSGYLFKVLYEIVATPITYLIVRKVKEYEGIDTYDRNINYTPFSFSEEK